MTAVLQPHQGTPLKDSSVGKFSTVQSFERGVVANGLHGQLEASLEGQGEVIYGRGIRTGLRRCV